MCPGLHPDSEPESNKTFADLFVTLRLRRASAAVIDAVAPTGRSEEQDRLRRSLAFTLARS
jgi:hypothetical protein